MNTSVIKTFLFDNRDSSFLYYKSFCIAKVASLVHHLVMTIQNNWVRMPAHRRELYFKIIDNHTDFHPITLRLHFLDGHFPLEKIDAALKWLVAEKYVGKNFLRWFEYVCKNSDLEMHRVLLSIVDSQKLAPIIAGRNFRS